MGGMRVVQSSPGPDIVLAGSARSGTSHLASRIGQHPSIDPGAVKEPEYFSRFWGRGADWYEGLFGPRREGVLRLDASMSYTAPQYPEALSRVRSVAPDAFLVYAVRDPVRRALSHYRLLRHYFEREDAATFGDALDLNDVYAGAGNYRRWLDALYGTFPRDRVLIVPFDVVTRGGAATRVIFEQAGLAPYEPVLSDAEEHTNQVVEFRHGALMRARRMLMRSGLYPSLRRRLGAQGMRRLRALATHEAPTLSLDEAIASCSDQTLHSLDELATSAIDAVEEALTRQDEALGLSWADGWRPAASAGVERVRQALELGDPLG